MTDLPEHGTLEAQLLELFIHAIWDERHRAHAKHGATSMEQAPLLGHKRASVLAEEAVECGKALNDHEHGDIHLFGEYEIGPKELRQHVDADTLDKELIQTAAMAYTWWANRRGDQLEPLPPAPTCQQCGRPKNAHSRTRDGGYLTGHPFMDGLGDPPPAEANTVRVYINSVPYTGTVGPDGTLHVYVDRPPVSLVDEALLAGGMSQERLDEFKRSIGALERSPGDLNFHEVSVAAGAPDPSKGIYPILSADGRPYPPPVDDPDGGRRGD